MTYSYISLSELTRNLSNPQDSEQYAKSFLKAVREGQIQALQLAEQFELPKLFVRRGSQETYRKKHTDYLAEHTAAFKQWHEKTVNQLHEPPCKKVSITRKAVEEGQVNFKELATQTRRNLNASFERGHRLGKNRHQAAAQLSAPASTADAYLQRSGQPQEAEHVPSHPSALHVTTHDITPSAGSAQSKSKTTASKGESRTSVATRRMSKPRSNGS